MLYCHRVFDSLFNYVAPVWTINTIRLFISIGNVVFLQMTFWNSVKICATFQWRQYVKGQRHAASHSID